jgi:VIT1/CCC1 family predicted Fe2+/Mn2+ transporter
MPSWKPSGTIASSFAVAMIALFFLGAFLGRLSRTSVLLNGGLATLAGMFMMLLVYLIGTG